MSISWLQTPLFRNVGGWDAVVGVDDRGTWYVRSTEPVPASSDEGAVSLLPLMQDGYGGTLGVARSRIIAALGESRLPRELESTFPYYAPVLFAFKSMQGWTEWAVRWFVEL